MGAYIMRTRNIRVEMVHREGETQHSVHLEVKIMDHEIFEDPNTGLVQCENSDAKQSVYAKAHMMLCAGETEWKVDFVNHCNHCREGIMQVYRTARDAFRHSKRHSFFGFVTDMDNWVFVYIERST